MKLTESKNYLQHIEVYIYLYLTREFLTCNTVASFGVSGVRNAPVPQQIDKISPAHNTKHAQVQMPVPGMHIRNGRRRRCTRGRIDFSTLHWHSHASANQFNCGNIAHQRRQDRKSQKANDFCRWIK